MIFLLVFLAGGAGSLLRFSLDAAINRHWLGSMPIATFLINLSGSFLLGVLTGLLTRAFPPATVSASFDLSQQISLVIGGGFLGGFTTFSTAMLEAARSTSGLHRTVLLAGQAAACTLMAATGLVLAV